MLIGDYFDEISRLLHEHETAGFLLSCDVLTDARSDDLGSVRATLTFSDRSELHVREYVRVSDARVERLALAIITRTRQAVFASVMTTLDIGRWPSLTFTSTSARISLRPRA